ncbi:hypothetical protein D0868_01331 [Hortaea werneckii]|uniref:Uncharacterized protein n=1 Tax=Hortaea werneckii TaxID=91943 RepID=A0A3M6ZHR2_HORWE|nr:hypothetical protein D0868_01331 [Hortaea werneckii]
MGYVQYPSDETWVDAGISGQVLEGAEAHYAAAKRQDEHGSIRDLQISQGERGILKFLAIGLDDVGSPWYLLLMY